jgi:hypothetical protein
VNPLEETLSELYYFELAEKPEQALNRPINLITDKSLSNPILSSRWKKPKRNCMDERTIKFCHKSYFTDRFSKGDFDMNNFTTLYEINREAFSILAKELGLANTMRFLNQFNTGKGDYTKQKDELFSGKTVQDIADEIRKKDSGTPNHG